ncbi:MAG: hypothetical protein HYS22_07290 [Deltaproteobacteria bacterium]|nr:hypothetical protein [Deltaproteobacteria bacterium]
MKTADESRVGELLEGLAAPIREAVNLMEKPAVLSCGGVFLRRQSIPEKLKAWRISVNLPHEEVVRNYRINPQTTEFVFHLIIRRENLN